MTRRQSPPPEHRSGNLRQGTEVVELALVLPLMLLLTAGTLEICEATMLRQKLEIAAYEGARVGIQQDASVSDIQQAAKDYLDVRGIQYGDDIATVVSVTPDPSTASTFDPIVVTVTVEAGPNISTGLSFYRLFGAGDELTSEVTMLKEHNVSP